MITASEMLLDDAHTTLVQKVAAVCSQNNLEEAFVSWLLPEQIPGVSIAGSIRLLLHTQSKLPRLSSSLTESTWIFTI